MNIFKEIPRIWRKVNRAADDVGESFKKIEEVGQAFREARGWIEDQGRRRFRIIPEACAGLQGYATVQDAKLRNSRTP